MYESFFGLSRRPFSATPDPDCCAGVETMQSAFDQLCGFVDQGEGIAILSSPPGMGKTLLCQRFAIECQQDFRAVFLANGNFETRRSLLQAMLYELGRPYAGMDEQELRLEVISVANAAIRKTKGVFLIVDEAHLATQCVLDEIRSMTNLVKQATPLVRVLLSAQLQFEETIAGPGYESFNQRVRAQTTLEPISRKESLDYIEFRLAWAGAAMKSVFSPDAAALIIQVSDGIPRCINQLCDHSLFIAFAGGERPVKRSTVAQALDDLKRLPLQWQLPESMLEEPQSTTGNRSAASNAEVPRDSEKSGENFSIEIGDGLELAETESYSTATLEIGESTVFEIGSPTASEPVATKPVEKPSKSAPIQSKAPEKSPELATTAIEQSASASGIENATPLPAPQRTTKRSVRREGRTSAPRNDFWTSLEAPTFAEEKVHVLATARTPAERTSTSPKATKDEVVSDRYAALDAATMAENAAARKKAKAKPPESTLTRSNAESTAIAASDAIDGSKVTRVNSKASNMETDSPKSTRETAVAHCADIIRSVEEEIVGLARETSAAVSKRSDEQLHDDMTEYTLERLRRARQTEKRVAIPQFDVILPVDDGEAGPGRAGETNRSAKRADAAQSKYAQLFSELRNRRSG